MYPAPFLLKRASVFLPGFLEVTVATVLLRFCSNRRLFQDADTEPGLAGAGHADNHGMCRQAPVIVEHKIVHDLVSVRVMSLTEIERAELLLVNSQSRVIYFSSSIEIRVVRTISQRQPDTSRNIRLL